MARAADPSLHCTPSPCPGTRVWPGDPREPGPTGEVWTDGHSPTPASSFVCCGGALPGRWELGAGRVGEGRSRQRPLGACGHGLSYYPCAGFAPQGHQQLVPGGHRAVWLLEVLEASAGPVSPRPFLPSRGSGPHCGEHPSTAWVWHRGFLGHPASLGSATLCSSWAPHLALIHLPLATETTRAQQVPLATACLPPGSPKRPWGTGKGWVGVSWGQGGLWLIWGWN